MIRVLDVHNVFELVQQMFLKWPHGMGVKPDKLHLLHEQKIVLGVKDVKVHAQQIS
jgi:NOL1/NOP2/fmu family ribosome biogenesis protein